MRILGVVYVLPTGGITALLVVVWLGVSWTVPTVLAVGAVRFVQFWSIRREKYPTGPGPRPVE